MGDLIKKLKPEELKACQMALDLINRLAFDLGMAKRSHQHLWNEIGDNHGLQPDDKVVIDYQSGYVTLKEKGEING